MDRPAKVNISTQTCPPMAHVETGSVGTRKVVEHSSKRKVVPPLEDRKAADIKRAKRGDTTYAGVCRERKGSEADLRVRVHLREFRGWARSKSKGHFKYSTKDVSKKF